MADFFQLVPLEVRQNLAYRLTLRRRAQEDAQFQRACLEACKQDVLFFLAAWCFLCEPRPKMIGGVKQPSIIPFIPWPHQVPVIRTIREKLGYEDIVVEKSRGEGASWIAVFMALHDWIFDPMSIIGFVSRNETAVDSSIDPAALLWKFDWALKKLPVWMGGEKEKDWKRNLQDHTFVNYRNGSTLTGYPATSEVGSGARTKWFLMDELSKFPRGDDHAAMASTQAVTNSRFVVSTPLGDSGAYYDIVHNPSSVVRVQLRWQDNITKNRGMYRYVGGNCVAADPKNNPLPDGYAESSRDRFSRLRIKGFTLEGVDRSPWYDHECDRPGATPFSIAQEQDISYGGTKRKIFGSDFFAKAEEGVRKPFIRGIMDYHKETLKPAFDVESRGQCLLWTALDAQGNPPHGSYVLGADFSTGQGGSWTSNSAAVVLNVLTGEQVLEFAVNTMPTVDFTEACLSICKWFHNAYFIWEMDGPGTGVANIVKKWRYSNIYMRQLMTRRGRHKTKEMGWHTSAATKEVMFDAIGQSVRSGEVTVRSDMLAKELGQYIRIGPLIEHVLNSKTSSGESAAAGRAHGDRAIAFGVAIMGMRDRPLLREVQADPNIEAMKNPPPNTMEWRQKQYEDSQAEPDGWDDRDTSDFVRAA